MQLTTFFFIRHGETTWNKNRKMQGQTDIPLSKTGIAQANKLKEHFRNIPIDIFYTSPLKRALDTAAYIHTHHPDKPLISHPFLKERFFGDLEGWLFEDVVSRYPRMAFQETWHYPYFQPPNGERLIDVRTRAHHLIEKLLSDHKGQTIAIVSHGVTIRMCIQILLDLPIETGSTFETGNTSVTCITVHPQTGSSLQIVNYMKHLE